MKSPVVAAAPSYLPCVCVSVVVSSVCTSSNPAVLALSVSHTALILLYVSLYELCCSDVVVRQNPPALGRMMEFGVRLAGRTDL